MSNIAQRLKDAMEAKGYKQVDVIRLAEPIGREYGVRIGKSHMSQYLSGKTEPRKDILSVLAKTLDVDEEWLGGAADADDKTIKTKSSISKESSNNAYAANAENMGENVMRQFSKSSKLDNVLYDVRGPVVEEANRMADAGMHILKLNIGNPAPFGFRAPEEVVYDMRQQLTDCEGYSDSKGLFSARKHRERSQRAYKPQYAGSFG